MHGQGQRLEELPPACDFFWIIFIIYFWIRNWSHIATVCMFLFLVYFLLVVLRCQYQCKWLPGKSRLWKDLLCVEWDVKLYTHSLTHYCYCSCSCVFCRCGTLQKSSSHFKSDRDEIWWDCSSSKICINWQSCIVYCIWRHTSYMAAMTSAQRSLVHVQQRPLDAR